MADDRQKRSDPGDAIRDGVRAVSGILGAFKDAIEQTFNDLSDRGDISPDRAKDAARDAMKRAQEAMDDVRGRLEFVSRREFDALRTEIAELRAQVERHTTVGGHHQHGAAASGSGTPGTGPTGGSTSGFGAGGSTYGASTGGTGATGAGGSGTGDGSPGI